MDNADIIDIQQTFGAHTSLPDRFCVYVPNQDKLGVAVDQEPWVRKVLVLLADINGGATAMPPVQGAWLNGDGKLIVEQPVLVYSFIRPESFSKRLGEVVALVNEIGNETNQGEMAVEFNGELFLIEIK